LSKIIVTPKHIGCADTFDNSTTKLRQDMSYCGNFHKLFVDLPLYSLYNLILEGYSLYGMKIKEIRNSLSLSQTELATKIGISQNYLSEIENGKYDAKIPLLFRIAGALDICPHELLNLCDYCSKDCKRKFF
jgi:DNA-binding XRE family transcriptional regulator